MRRDRAGRPRAEAGRLNSIRSLPETPSARVRFRHGDPYRAAREWQRYEGTAQRELFRALRERFLARHAPATRWAVDLGSGPGRFTAHLGRGPAVRRVAVDIGPAMLRELEDRWESGRPHAPLPDLVRANALRTPFVSHAFGLVAALGNLLGFAEAQSDRLVEEVTRLVAPGGSVLLEVAPGPGERSRYLHRLPPTSVARLFRSAPGIVSGRIVREGFTVEPKRRAVPGEFRRFAVDELRARLESGGFRIAEVVAVAPALGADATRATAVAHDRKAWDHLLEVEERLGRSAERWPDAAAVLLAAEAPSEGPRSPAPPGPGSEG